MSGLADQIEGSDDRNLGFELPPPAPRADAEAVRASLLAVQAAQRAARERARRETWRARFWFVVSVGAIGVALFAFRAQRQRRAREVTATVPAAASPPTPAARSAPSAPPVAPSPSSSSDSPLPSPSLTAAAAPASAAKPTEQDLAAKADLPAQAKPPAPDVAASKLSLAAAELNDPAARPEACDELYRRQRWKLATVACLRAFELEPTNPDLALRVAQAMHARGRAVAAGEWAQRTIALDPRAAEAFVILARAETRAKQPAAAARSYRRYLELAPRGWHATEARDAVRAAKATTTTSTTKPVTTPPTGGRNDARTGTGDGTAAVEIPAPREAQASVAGGSKG